ncbi:MAG: DNA polymerase III subunit delta' [Planctomycetaceae bacterium]|nr:DNA polymerase III subunit delta' [Planctomycetaceae bacterium]
MPWHSVRGHDRIAASLRHSLGQGRLPHAFLFVGPEGVGKRTFALTLAQALLCERRAEAALDPCEACPGCLQVRAGSHPDLLQVARPEDKHDLPIAVIRDLCLDLGLKPARGARKVAIIDDADDLNDEAANSFLKTLEEPPPGSVLILIGTSAEVQLDTIVSRCRVVRFDPLPEAELAALLLEQGMTRDPAEADRLARLADGSVSRARGLASPELEQFRRALIDDLAGPRGFDPPALALRLGAFIKEASKESVAQRGRARLIVGELARFFRGLLWQTAGMAPPCPDPDDLRASEALAARLDPEAVLVLADRCLDADYQIQRKAYMPLILDSLLHDLGTLINPRG